MLLLFGLCCIVVVAFFVCGLLCRFDAMCAVCVAVLFHVCVFVRVVRFAFEHVRVAFDRLLTFFVSLSVIVV